MIMRSPGRNPHRVDITWRVRAITSSKSCQFAERMESELNEATQAGFTLVQMLERPEDHGCVLVMQKAVLQEGIDVDVGEESEAPVN